MNAGPAPCDDALLADYSETLGTWRMYVEIRFKLLGLIPTVTAAGVGVFGSRLSYPTVAVAAIAMLSILGVVMYDLRNTVFYDAAVHRAKELERLIGLPRTSAVGDAGGLFGERPRTRLALAGVAVWHDRALAVVYSVAFGGWAVVGVRALLEETTVLSDHPSARWAVAFAGGVVASCLLVWALAAYGRAWDADKSRMAPSSDTRTE